MWYDKTVPQETVGGAVLSSVARGSIQTRKTNNKKYAQFLEVGDDRDKYDCWMEIGWELDVSWTAEKEKWRSVCCPLLDAMSKVHPNKGCAAVNISIFICKENINEP